MKVTVTMFNDVEEERIVDEVETRDEPAVLILYMDDWKTRLVIPFESLIFWEERD